MQDYMKKFILIKKKSGKKMLVRRRPRRPAVVVDRALAPFAQRYITRQKYSSTFAMSSLTPSYSFNLNSCFDPDRSGIGHQPHGFDTLTQLYNRYRVIKCSYSITFYNTSTPIRLVALPSNEAAAFSNVSDACENPRARWALTSPQGAPKTLKGSVYIPSLVGRTKAQYMADDRFQALTTTSPAELAILAISAADMTDVVPDGTKATITLTYLVEYFDVKNLAQS